MHIRLSGILLASLLGLTQQARAAVSCQMDVFPGKEPQHQTAQPRRTIEPRNVNYHEIEKLPLEVSKIRDNGKLKVMEIFQLIENEYGPMPVKKLNVGFNLKQVEADTLKKVSQVTNTVELYQVIEELMFDLKDAHISVEFPSTLTWKNPLQFRNINRQLVVNFIDGTFPDGVRKPDLGDQLETINGMKPAAFKDQFGFYQALGNPLTDMSYFAASFGTMREARGLPLSTMKMDKLTLTLRSYATGKPYTIEIPIKKEGIGLIGSGLNGNKVNTLPVHGEAAKVADALPRHAGQIFSQFDNLHRAEARTADRERFVAAPGSIGEHLDIGGRNPMFKLPDDFQPIDFPDSLKQIPELKQVIDTDFFFAGTYMRDGKRVGFLRIPSYSPENLMTILPALRFYIKVLNESSDYLVIDQTNNPGGYVIFSDWVVKSLVGKYDTTKHLGFAVKPTQNFLREYLDLAAQMRANADGLLTPDEAENFAQRFEAEYKKIERAHIDGKPLSEPISMLAMSDYMETIVDRAIGAQIVQYQGQVGIAVPNTPQSKVLHALSQAFGPAAQAVDLAFRTPQVYDLKKKVYFLINELDFSGGDATPASLQDYGRVEIVGINSDRTAGAGGTVEPITVRGMVSMVLHITTSLMVRMFGRTVEGSGVHARAGLNIPMKISDIVDGGKNYFDRVANVLAAHQRENSAK